MPMESDPRTRKMTKGPAQRNANTSPLPQERQRLDWGVFGDYEVKLWMKKDKEKMENEQEKLWMSRGYFFEFYLPM